MADLLHDPAHLAAASFVDDHPQQRGLPRLFEYLDLRGAGAPAVEHEAAAPDLFQRAGRGVPGDERVVFLVDAVARVGDAVGEFPVIRQQQQPLAVHVESAHREDAVAPVGGGEEVVDGAPALGVAGGRQVAARFVQHEIARPGALQHLPVDPDLGALRVNLGPQFACDLPIDADAPFEDHLLRRAARGDPARREDLLQALQAGAVAGCCIVGGCATAGRLCLLFGGHWRVPW